MWSLLTALRLSSILGVESRFDTYRWHYSPFFHTLTSGPVGVANNDRPMPTLNPQIGVAPSLTPTIYDPTAPDPQRCPGYRASEFVYSTDGFSANLDLAGTNCQAYGNDIGALRLDVHYQTRERLNLKIYPRYLDAANRTRYLLPTELVPAPSSDGRTTNATSDLKLEWTNDPTFQFRVLRRHNDEELFSTYGHVIVYEDQFLELATNMVDDYNAYGLAENIRDFRLGTNHTQTFYAVDAGNTVDGNVYGTFPFYQETRYHEGGPTTGHGVYARNAHGQEWLLRDRNITYRTLGGSFDFYFLSGQTEAGESSALETIRQFQIGCVGTPAMQMFWTFGFHQCRWGYENVSVLQSVVQGYRDANIPLECMWNDIDILQLKRDFTSDENTFPVAGMQKFIADLHANSQHYVPIVDANIYAPNPENVSDAYEPWQRGADMGTFIRDAATRDFYYGGAWPGFSSWADWLLPSSYTWWHGELARWYKDIPFDGLWVDLNEASSFCVGSCGTNMLNLNPAHPPFLTPGEPYHFNYKYPEGFGVSNATEAASASAAEASQSSVLATYTPLPVPTTTTRGRTEPTPGVRNLNFPPYVINNAQDGHSLLMSAIAPDAVHNDLYNTTEYELHNLFGYQISNATYHALLSIFPGKRPFTLGRSTFAGSGKTTSHWGGDNTSTWGSMFLSISQALTFMMVGMPMFGADTCGFSQNTDYDLCARWMALSAFFPFYRNHNIKATIPQEAYRWSSVAEASRRAMAVRYSLLNYMYTLFYHAHTRGDTVMRALAWEFPEDISLRETYSQFLLGPSILVTPVLVPNMDTVRGVFPGVDKGTLWYDWYSLQPLRAAPRENVTLAAPREHINVHVRGGSILPLQEPRLTTAEVRNTPFSLLVALDAHGEARGDLYLDDGESLVPPATKIVQFHFANNVLTTSLRGQYYAAPPLANVTIAGLKVEPRGLAVHLAGEPRDASRIRMAYREQVLRIQGLEDLHQAGAWEKELRLVLGFS